jgi:hypothetical protein
VASSLRDASLSALGLGVDVAKEDSASTMAQAALDYLSSLRILEKFFIYTAPVWLFRAKYNVVQFAAKMII